MALEVNGQTIELDEEGYLVDLSSWTPEIAKALADGEDVDLSDDDEKQLFTKLESRQARKKSERIDDEDNKDSLMVFRLESLFSWSEFSKVNPGFLAYRLKSMAILVKASAALSE